MLKYSLIMLFCQNLYSNSLGNGLFQLHKTLQEEHPCWIGLNQSEYKDLKNLMSQNLISCSSISTIPKANIKELWQQLIFDLARDKYNNRIQCIKMAISFLHNNDKSSENSTIYQNWLGKTSSNLAQYFAYDDMRLHLFNQANEKARNVRYRSSIRLEDDKKFSEQYQNIQSLLTDSDKQSVEADKAIARIPFFSNQNLSENLITLVKNKLKADSIQNNYCKYHSSDPKEARCIKTYKAFETSSTNKREESDIEIQEQNLELKIEIENILKQSSKNFFTSAADQLENDVSLKKSKWDSFNNGTKNDNQFLWENGLVFEVLNDIFPEGTTSASHLALKSKLRNCIEGEYGTLNSSLDTIKDGFFYIFGGKLFLSEKLGYSSLRKIAQGLPKFNSKKFKTATSLRNAKNWALGDLSLTGADLSADAIYLKCIKKYPEYESIRVPNNCNSSNEKIVNEFTFKSLGLMSCMEEIRAAAVGI